MNFGAYGGDHGASQFGGGGFMASPAPGHGNQYGGGGGGGGKSKNAQSLRAFTIRHLLKETASADDDSFRADGHDIGTVTVVGRVTHFQEQATRVSLQVNDGTGSVEVTSWLDGQDTPGQKRLDWQVGRYVRVYGNLKLFDRKPSITGFCVKAITDHNEVTYHFLQAVMQHLHLTKGAPPQGAPAPAPGMGMAGPAKTPGGYGAPAAGGYGAPFAAAPAARGGDLHSDLKAVFNLPHALNAPNGLSVEQAIAELQRMGRNVSAAEVMAACEFLAAEGVVYSTCNDTTFKSTGS
ncbi:hypothetical protein HYH03_016842 [Edaphochlamys debaryana]|uniref:Uncharacterized protein n=1 Tax=Edaphochlamys debaryana TaxID=47281 RepID=A0A835XL81_9CHLO|nr:hypothetical protein HYH03_016842 [Edaphochlamys debaryana]|eukprot:KAG2484296.1 hypothetical protein HYH03_016842 [Edaphochlamys debaryana]